MDTLDQKVVALRTLLRQARVAESNANGCALSLYAEGAAEGSPEFHDAWATYRYWSGWRDGINWVLGIGINSSPQEEIEALERFVALPDKERQRMIRRRIDQSQRLAQGYFRAAMHAVGPNDHWLDYRYHLGRIAGLHEIDFIMRTQEGR
jgi:hypothetical protein